ncbi:biopolymer transporter ExbD [Solimonas sp. K1W22B-7]|uniref:ExbD/TolR family protein n=1 Tax=Solimonas sp. K1W22B-7 TaxID=2303331 RepID=UPI000E337BDE|nr:biopolymer transporter ExbD [Solimonas sp. K1W22B-7]AXQ28477.1 biopolymer transporter ExbD [Solimonas sp. K1W22B-7]
MGMNIGSGAGSGDPDVIVDINTTPLIDVMLVLLIMLIITIPIQLHSVNLNMPLGNPPPPAVPPEVVRVDIAPSGSILWNGETLADLPALEARLKAAAAQEITPELHVRPDKQAAYRVVASVMAAIQRGGLTKVGLVGGEQFAD